MPDRLVLPPPPPEPDPPGLPVVSVLAPLVVAGVLLVVTRSPAVLLLAMLSPVLAVAQLIDGRVQVRRRRRRARRLREAELDELEHEANALLAERRAEQQRGVRASGALVADPSWIRRPEQAALVLGTADLPTEPVLDGRATNRRERDLLSAARLLPDAPLLLDPAATVAASGPAPLPAAFARAVAVQRAACGLPPEPAAVLADATVSDADLAVEVLTPFRARVVGAHGPAARLEGVTLAPSLVTAAGLDRVLAGLPGAASPPIEALLSGVAPGPGLTARFLSGTAGPLDVDLVADGPHAVVAGTTGSGKSALLTAWVLGLAAAHPATRLQVLLVDCKGGAAFDPLAALPHVVGVLTDLDPEGTERAVESLAAELRRRERSLRSAGAADVAGSGEPRLVIVVDEFRALLDARPALAAVFVDLAARGRSLGIHLVLCTQRAAGSVRDEVLANCGLRISLRVHDAADSTAVVGVPDAARLPAGRPGAAVLRRSGGRPEPVVVARVERAAVTEAVRALAAGPPPAGRRPWLEPLPTRLPLADLMADAEEGRIVLGRLDLPAEQRQPVLSWDPRAAPRLLAVGRPGSGRSSLLATVAVQLGATVLPEDPAAAWDLLAADDRPLLVDDAEVLLDRFGELAPAAVDRLLQRLRGPDAAPTVLCARGPAAWTGTGLRALAGLFDRVLLLGLELDDHLAMGGARSAWRDAVPPGRAVWDGVVAQLALAGVPAPRTPVAAPATLDLRSGTWLLATSAPERRLGRLRSAGCAAATPDQGLAEGVLVATPTAWQRSWAQLSRLASTAPILLDGVPASDARAIVGRSVVLPPCSHPDDVVLVPPEGPPVRCRLPGPA